MAENTALKGVSELARGVEYTEPIKTSWRPPKLIISMPEKRHQRIWKKLHIDVEGIDPPPPIKAFKDMKFPKPILEALRKKGIEKPSPIQIQGIPTVLSGKLVELGFFCNISAFLLTLELSYFCYKKEFILRRFFIKLRYTFHISILYVPLKANSYLFEIISKDY